MKKIYLYSLIMVLVVVFFGTVYYYSASNDPIPARQRYLDIFDELPSVSCTNLVLTAWSNSQLTLDESLKVAINDILHSKGITAPISGEQFDEIVAENDGPIKELFTRAQNPFYEKCEEVFLQDFVECEETNSNHGDFLKCWVDSSDSNQQQNLYRDLTDNLVLPDVEDESEIDLAPDEIN